MAEDDEPVVWRVEVVNVAGPVCSVELQGWHAELLDLQREIKKFTGVRKKHQLLFVGGKQWWPRRRLSEVLPLSGGVVTLIRSAHQLRCGSCGARGVFGRAPRLRACDGCGAVFYCNGCCQRRHWPTHKSSCLKRGARRVA